MRSHAVAIAVAITLLGASGIAQLPAISWTCPMHPDVLEPKKSACGICGMDLEPIRLVLVYTCPVHAVIEQSSPGKCRICSRELVQKTAALTFTCAGNRELSQIEPGRCADGSAMVPRYTPRVHGDHNPKHGGIFFMAPDNWHHLEGTYPAAGRFRVYVYDDFSRPLSRTDARKVRGRVVTKETFDPKTGTTRELASAPLTLAANGAYFEARIENLALPAKLTAKIAFRSGDKESRFDFTFPEYSRDLPAVAPRDSSSASAGPAPAVPAATSTASAPVAPVAPTPPGELVDELNVRRAEVESLLRSGALAAIYVPALQAKDVALQIQGAWSGRDEDAVETSVKQIVLAAYQLDSYGDLGDGEKVEQAYQSFTASITELSSLVSGRPR